MKNRRMILFLLSVIAALALAEWALTASGRKKSVSLRTCLVDAAADYATFVIERRGDRPIVLEKGASWTMARPVSAEVEKEVLEKIFDVLERPLIDESVSEDELMRNGKSLRDYALDDPRLRVTLSNATSCVSISFGKVMPSGDDVYVARSDDHMVRIVKSSVMEALDLSADGLRRRRAFHFDGLDGVKSFDVRQRAGTVLSFVRDGDGGWRLGTDKAETARVEKLLDALVTAEAKAFVWPTGATNEPVRATESLLAGYGLDAKAAVKATLRRADGESESVSFGNACLLDKAVSIGNAVSIGPAAGDGLVYAFVHPGGGTNDLGRIVTVPAALKDAVAQGREGFVDPRLFPTASATVGALTLADGDVTLTATCDGKGRWQLVEPISAPADGEAVRGLLARVLALTTADVAESGVAVSVGADAKAVVVSRAALFPKGGGLEQLRDLDVVNFEAGEVRRLSATTAAGAATSVVFARDRKAWNVEAAPEGAVVSDDGVARVLKALAPLKALRVARLRVQAKDLAEFGLDEPSFSLAVDLERENAMRRNILVGAETEDGVFATVGASDAVFVLSRDVAKALAAPLAKRP